MAQDPKLLNYAARMRHEATPFEIILWRHISRSQIGGYKFRRQHVVGGRIFDFFCPAKNLAVEIDGETHDPVRDHATDEFVAQKGIAVIRFTNEEIQDNLHGVLETLLSKLDAAPNRWVAPHPNPSPKGEGLDTQT